MTQATLHHDDALALLDAYIDGELDAASALAFDRHLAGCEICQARLAERRRLSSRIHSAPLRLELPPQLAAVVAERAIGPTSMRPVRARRLFSAPWPKTLAAGFLLTLSGYFVGHSLPRPAELGDAVLDAHLRSVSSSRSVDVLSSDHHTVKPWLSSRLPFSPPVPDLANSVDTLIGARVDYLNHREVAALVYQHGKHQVNVFIWPTSAMPGVTAARAGGEGYHILTAKAGDFTAAIVSDMSSDELERFRDRWQAATELSR